MSEKFIEVDDDTVICVSMIRSVMRSDSGDTAIWFGGEAGLQAHYVIDQDGTKFKKLKAELLGTT